VAVLICRSGASNWAMLFGGAFGTSISMMRGDNA
jgi:hypothetical protein